MSSVVASSMQAALLIREKQRLRRIQLQGRKKPLATHLSTKFIAPFSQFPPKNWVRLVILALLPQLMYRRTGASSGTKIETGTTIFLNTIKVACYFSILRFFSGGYHTEIIM